MAEISMIVPVYKAEKYLNRCIDSLLAQTYTDFELILVDDGSPDKSGKICDDYAGKDSRIKVIHKENAGVSAARNSGLDVSSGKYIMFCDSDDYVEPDYLELMYTAAEADGTDIGVCGFRIILDDDEEKNQTVLYKGTQPITVLGLSGFLDVLDSNLLFCVWNKIYKAEIIKKYRLKMDETMKYSEDLHFNLAYFLKMNGGVSLVSSPLYNYENRNNDSVTKKYAEDLWPVTQKTIFLMKKMVGRLGDDAKRFEERLYTIFFHMIYTVLTNTFKKDNPQSFFKKYFTNVRIVHSKEYKEAVQKGNAGSFPPVFFRILKTGCYFLIFCFLLSARIKDRIVTRSKNQ